MNTIKLNSLISYSHTLVPNWFIDYYMPGSNGDFTKVYLLLLRYSANGIDQLSTTAIADVLNLTESDITRAFKYWASKGLINIEMSNKYIQALSLIEPEELVSIDTAINEAAPTMETSHLNIVQSNTDISQPDEKEETANQVETIRVNLSAKPQYSMEELSKFVSSAGYKDLVYVTGRYLGKTLSQNDLSTLISFHDWLGLPLDVIEWLVEYCASNSHTNMRYIEKVAIEWADQHIDTLEKAKLRTETYNKKYYAIKKALGFANRNPVLFEIKMMDKWLNEYNFDMKIILEACDRTMKQAPNGSFNYAEKILNQWHKKKVHTLDDIKSLDEQHLAKTASAKKASASTPVKTNNKFINFEQRDYDFEKIEKKAMEMILKESVEGGYK